MKYKYLTIALLFITFLSKAQEQKFREITGFSGVANTAGFNIILEKGDKEGVFIEAKHMDFANIITEVTKKGILKISKKRGFKLKSKYELKIKVIYKSLSTIINSGSGFMTSNDEILAQSLSIISSGSGKVDIQSLKKAKSLSVKLSGSGNVKVNSGYVKSIKLIVSGSGRVNTLGLQSKLAECVISGSGGIKLFVTDKIASKISGSGGVKYKGDPKNINSKISGSGSVNKI